jgi:hypothetical protein
MMSFSNILRHCFEVVKVGILLQIHQIPPFFAIFSNSFGGRRKFLCFIQLWQNFFGYCKPKADFCRPFK